MLILFAKPAESTTCLSAYIELTDEPRVELFVDLVKADCKIACNVRSSLHRLIFVASNQKMRRKVWRRMLRNELEFADRTSLTHVENLANACNMPLR